MRNDDENDEGIQFPDPPAALPNNTSTRSGLRTMTATSRYSKFAQKMTNFDNDISVFVYPKCEML